MSSDAMYISKRLVKSKAFLSLKTPAACQVYLIFLIKCVVKEEFPGHWVIKNNGKIQFSYDEALEKWNISDGRFKRAIEQLVENGFIDITRVSSGTRKQTALYAISDRWKKFGEPDFEEAHRIKRPKEKKVGFQKGNKFGVNSK